MKKIIYTIIALILPFFAYAQDVEGVEIDSVMTYGQVVAKFGVPDKFEVQDADFPDGAKIWYYKYGKNELVFSNTDGLIGFYIYDDRFSLITNYLEGGLKVGDPLSKIQNVNIQGPLEHHCNEPDGSKIYHLFSHTDCPLWIWIKNGIIVYMDLSIPL